MNRSARAFLPLLLLVQAAIAGPMPRRPQSEWVNSAGTVTVTCHKGSTVINGQEFENYNWLINGQPAVWNTVPLYRLECKGIGQGLAADEESVWLEDRYLVLLFKQIEAISIIDTRTREILLANCVEAYTAAPDGKSWAAIAYRTQSQETDTLRLIEPATMARDLPKAVPYENPYAYIPSVPLDGLAMTRPLWTADGKGVLLVLATKKKVEAVRIDVAARRITKRIPLPKLKATGEELSSGRILPQIDARFQPALQAVLRDL